MFIADIKKKLQKEVGWIEGEVKVQPKGSILSDEKVISYSEPSAEQKIAVPQIVIEEIKVQPQTEKRNKRYKKMSKMKAMSMII